MQKEVHSSKKSKKKQVNRNLDNNSIQSVNKRESYIKEQRKSHRDRKKEFLTKLWRRFFTKPCPKCKTPIDKQGEWFETKCTNCKFHFCWECGVKFPDHNNSIHEKKNRLIHNVHMSILALSFIFISWLVFAKFGFPTFDFLGVFSFDISFRDFSWSDFSLENLWYGIGQLYWYSWRLFVGLVFLVGFQGYFLDSSLPFELKFSSMANMIIGLIVTHFWGGYYVMLKIIGFEALIWGCYSIVSQRWENIRERKKWEKKQ